MINRFISIVLGSVVVSSCWKAEPPSIQKNPNTSNNTKVAVLCEGNYLWNNAQLDVYYPDSHQLWSNAFEAVNQQPIGDVLQSGVVVGNSCYLIVNNSGMMLKLDPQTLKLQERVAISKSPRYATQWGGCLYVTDLESNAITKYDTLTKSKEQLTVLPNASGVRAGWTEQILVWNNHIVAAVNDGYLWVHDPSGQTSRLIPSDTGTQYLGVDAQNRLWVLASHEGNASITCWDDSWNLVEKVSFLPNHLVSRMAFSKSKDTLWFLVNGNLQARTISDPKTAINRVVPYTTGYGLGVDPLNGDIYISDAYDYIRKGRVVRLNATGDSILSDFFTGIIPSNFVFFPK